MRLHLSSAVDDAKARHLVLLHHMEAPGVVYRGIRRKVAEARHHELVRQTREMAGEGACCARAADLALSQDDSRAVRARERHRAGERTGLTELKSSGWLARPYHAPLLRWQILHAGGGGGGEEEEEEEEEE